MLIKTDSSVESIRELFSFSIDRVSNRVKGYACIPFAWDLVTHVFVWNICGGTDL
jgi:hypothetical protein